MFGVRKLEVWMFGCLELRKELEVWCLDLWMFGLMVDGSLDVPMFRCWMLVDVVEARFGSLIARSTAMGRRIIIIIIII